MQTSPKPVTKPVESQKSIPEKESTSIDFYELDISPLAGIRTLDPKRKDDFTSNFIVFLRSYILIINKAEEEGLELNSTIKNFYLKELQTFLPQIDELEFPNGVVVKSPNHDQNSRHIRLTRAHALKYMAQNFDQGGHLIGNTFNQETAKLTTIIKSEVMSSKDDLKNTRDYHEFESVSKMKEAIQTWVETVGLRQYPDMDEFEIFLGLSFRLPQYQDNRIHHKVRLSDLLTKQKTN